MKILAQEEYGVRCLLRIARAKERWLTIPEVAHAEKLSIAYVGKILALLRQGRLIESARGRNGGYRLAAAPGNIYLGSVLKVLGEPLYDDPGFCQQHRGSESDGDCVHRDSCNLRMLWQGLENMVQRVLDKIALSDLLQDENRVTALLQAGLGEPVVKKEPLLPLIPQKAGSLR
jgi:Rrf2 family transcriptional regulator, iron-sulfur cluster assembly transcription factor